MAELVNPFPPSPAPGTGKSTLLKLMVGTLEPVDGMVKRHNHLRIGQYHQHLTELLDPEKSPLEYMVGPKRGDLGDCFPWFAFSSMVGRGGMGLLLQPRWGWAREGGRRGGLVVPACSERAMTVCDEMTGLTAG